MRSNFLRLRRQVGIRCFVSYATLLLSVERRDIIAVLKLAKENGGRLDQDTLTEKFFPGYPSVVGANLLKRYQDERLIDSDGQITDIGKYALDTGGVPLPEYGKYRLYVVEDPLVPEMVVAIERINETEADLDSRERRQERLSISTTPLSDYKRKIARPILVWLDNTPQEVYLDKIYELIKEEKVSESEFVALEAEVPDKGPSLLRMSSSKWKGIIRLDCRITLGDSWREFVKANKLDWAGAALTGYLRVPFGVLSSEQAESFERSISSGPITLKESGTFNVDRIAVEIQPETQQDAEVWGFENLVRMISRYIAREEDYVTLLTKTEVRFREFAPKQLPKTREDMAKEIFNREVKGDEFTIPQVFWFLQMPIDLMKGKSQ